MNTQENDTEWKTYFWWDSTGRVEAELKDGRTILGTVQVEAIVDKDLEERPMGYVLSGSSTFFAEDILRWRNI